MDFADCLGDRTLSAKQKTRALADWLLANATEADRLVVFAKKCTAVDKATCLEAFEYATKTNPEVGTRRVFEFAAAALPDAAPRVKWEAAKVIANLAASHGKHLGKAIPGLLANATHEGTVVRWSAARAIGAILVLGTTHNAELLATAEDLCAKERDTAIRNHYLKALKKLVKAR